MLKIRTIPCLLLKNNGLVKTVKFKDPKYVGDPINAVKIFNEKEVDELIFLDITATTENRKPNFQIIKDIASEAFMPCGYGGGIRDLNDVKKIFNLGIEKIVINSYALENPQFVKDVSDYTGSQSVVISLDLKKSLFGKYEIYIHGGEKHIKTDVLAFAKTMVEFGAGELLINSIDRDGTMSGYDIPLLNKITATVDIPVIACGGAGRLEDFSQAVNEGGASAVAAGSFFVFHGKHRAVLITYPQYDALEKLFKENQ